MSIRGPLHLAVALDGAGWHPAAWRERDARADAVAEAGYWVGLVREAERGLIDFVTIEDTLAPPSPGGRVDRVAARLDAVLVAARVAPTTSHVGIVPTVTTTHTEPFHASKAIATLDFVTRGRAGWRAKVSGTALEAGHFGRRSIPDLRSPDAGDADSIRLRRALFDEAADYVEVVRRLWDSWEDDAEIRDVATGRFIDREKLHYIDFEGPWFRVRGPSITPRPPQGQPLVTVLAHAQVPYRLAARAADLVYVTPLNGDHAHAIREEVRTEERAAAGRSAERLRLFADLVVFIDPGAGEAGRRRARLDERLGTEYPSDALVFAGTPEQLADLLQTWSEVGFDGFRLRPAAIPHDLTGITQLLVPELQRRGLFRRRYEAATLRGLLGLQRPVNRYAPSA